MLSVTLGTLVAPIWWLNNLVFAAVIFVAFFIRQFGPRRLALGFIGFIAYFISLFFHAHFSEVPWLFLGIAVGAALAYAMRFWVWPDRPGSILRHNAYAFRAQLRRICRGLARRALANDCSGRDYKWLRKRLGTLNELALSLEESSASPRESGDYSEPHPNLRQWVLESELALESMAESTRRLIQSGPLPKEFKRELHRAWFAALESLQEDDGRLAKSRLREFSPRKPQSVTGPNRAPDLVAVGHFNQALADFAETLNAHFQPELESHFFDGPVARHDRTRTNSKPAKPAGKPAKEKRRLEFRQTVQATLAGIVAIAAGEAISRQRWYWAVIAAFVIFTRTNTRTETLVKGWQRVVGTVVGVVAGLVIGEAVTGHFWVQMVLIYVCIFFAYLLIGVSYAWMTIWFTLLLSVLYSLLGLLTPGLLELRLLLTLVGAAVGVLCAAFVLPTQTRHKIRDAAVAVLEFTGPFLAQAGAAEPADRAGSRQARELDRTVRELRQAAVPLQRRFLPVDGREQNQLVEATAAIAFFTRQLARAAPRESFQLPELTETSRQLSENIHALAAALKTANSPRIDSVDSRLDAAWRKLDEQSGDGETGRWIHSLQRIDREVMRIAESA